MIMLSTILLAGSILVTHAPGWSDPIITVDLWSDISGQDKTLTVFGDDTLHQFWDRYNQETRIGYKVYLPDGTVIFPETMVSGDVWSIDPTATVIHSDSIAGFWRQGVPAWYCVRDSTGGELVPTSLFQSDSYYNRPNVEVAGDSLGRIHAVTVISSGVLYTITEPGLGEVWRDTVPGSYHEVADVQVDGSRVHIIYESAFATPTYVQYDLEGNIVIPTVTLIEGLTFLSPTFTTALDGDGNIWAFFALSQGYIHLSLFKVDGATGEVLICDKEIWDPVDSSQHPTILQHPDGDRMVLMWIENEMGGPLHVMYSVIDLNGDFIEAPYSAYDYTDEEIQEIYVLEATINDLGDVFAIWNQGDVEVGGVWIVMGWFDHNWVGIEDEETGPVEPGDFRLFHSLNPFSESMTISVEGEPVPGQLAVYDLSGRIVRTLFRSGDETFLWDGRSADGGELPAGTYIVEGASAGRLASVTVVKI